MRSENITSIERKRTFVIKGDITAATGSEIYYYWLKIPDSAELVDARYMQSTAANGATTISINTIPDTNATDAALIKALPWNAITKSTIDTGTQVEIMTLLTTTSVGGVSAIPTTGYATAASRQINGNSRAVEIIVPQSATTAHAGTLILTFAEV
jgi:hypothetical protein